MLVDDPVIDSLIAELDVHQIDIGPHVTAHVAGHAPGTHTAAHRMQSITREPEHINSNRLSGIATDGDTTSEAEATTAAICINTSHAGRVSGVMRGVARATCETVEVPEGAPPLPK